MPGTKTIRQSAIIPASPGRVYAALANPAKHRQFTGEGATFVAKVGGAFSAYGGYITGVNLVLRPGKSLVQAWRSKGWPKETFTIVTYGLSGVRGGKTKLTFTQLGVPANDYLAKSKGWREHYWTPLIAMFRAKR